MTPSGGIFDFADKKERLDEVVRELEDPQLWEDPDRAQALGRERATLENVVSTLSSLEKDLSDAEELIRPAAEEEDAATVDEVCADLGR